MKQLRTFVFSMATSACLFFAGLLVIGSGDPDTRPLARSLGAATINECKVMCRIEGRTNGVYAVFDFENPTKEDKEIQFNYLATRIPPMSMMSRMGPRPETVKKGIMECRVKEGHMTEEVLLKEPAPVVSSNMKTNGLTVAANAVVSARLEMETTPETWSLVVSRGEIKGIHGWGAVAPAASDAMISLDKGEAVLASTVPEKAAK